MAGAHDDRESVAKRTGLTPAQRDQIIWTRYHQKVPQRKIAAEVGMTQVGVLQAIKRLNGIVRDQSKPKCSVCGLKFSVSELVGGKCPECVG